MEQVPSCLLPAAMTKEGVSTATTEQGSHIAVAGCAHQDLVGVPAAARGRRVARRLELLALPLFQLAPHALIAVSVIAHPEAFSARVNPPPLAGEM